MSASVTNKSRRRLAATTLAILSIIPTTLIVAPKSAQASSWCQCVRYVTNRFRIPTPSGNAKDFNNGYLQKNGYLQTLARRGSIVVMETSFPGANTTYGHVGVLDSIDNYGKPTLRGSNQRGGTLSTEDGCTNVNLAKFATSIHGRQDISFWAKTIALSSNATGRILDANNPDQPVYMHPSFMDNNAYHFWESIPSGSYDSVGNQYYYLKSKATGRVLDSGGANGTDVYAHPSLMPGNSYQMWKFVLYGDSYYIVSKATGRVLDSGGNSGQDPYMHPNFIPGNPFHLWRLSPSPYRTLQ